MYFAVFTTAALYSGEGNTSSYALSCPWTWVERRGETGGAQIEMERGEGARSVSALQAIS